MLVWIKLLHTAIWMFFVACIVALPIAGIEREFRWAGALAALVLAECAVLEFHRYTDDRAGNFDIYLPVWLARRNTDIFGTIFAIGGSIAIWQWLAAPR